jgi:hypothetical protein
MLFFIAIPIILTAFLLYQYITFIRVYYIGQSLHKFRELRSDVTLFLSANVKQGLSVQEVTEYHQFLLGVNAIINHFDLLKPEFTKFNSAKTISSNILFSSEKLTFQSNNTIILNHYKGRLRDCILTAFKAIPFCRLRLFIFFLRILATVSIAFGIDKYGKQLSFVTRLNKIEKDMLSKNGFPCNP